ncbi:MAG: exosome complex exonuclease Rrp41 [DPANN group archaeon]|nr:exosome complex exonuclease Rrp41 [DPANN group archaeon]
MGGIGAPEKLIVKGKRLDGRAFDELRPIQIKAGVVKNADGSAIIVQGETKIIAAVYGPREVFPKHFQEADRAHLNCVYDMAAFSTPERARPGPSRRSVEISKVIRDALAPAVFLEKYPKTAIDVYIEVTNANAGTRVAAICAASVALADAGIEMRDLVTAVASGKADGQLLLDLFELEDNYGEADMPLAIMPQTGEITLLQMDGEVSQDEAAKLIEMSMQACQKIYELQKKALREKYLAEGAATGEASE